MKNSVVIKGNKYGIIVVLDKELPFEELKEEIAAKFRDSAKFLGEASMGITFHGRDLSDEEMIEVLDIISENSDLKIVCVVDTDKEREEHFRQMLEKQTESEQEPEESPETEDETETEDSDTNGGQFYRGTLRSGQVIESEASIIILGDVNPGAKVVSSGNVIILGALKGTVFAGVTGEMSSFVIALEMNPMQIRIGDFIARAADTVNFKKKSKKEKQKEKERQEAKIAFVDNGNIYIEPLTKEVLNDIHF